jgi:hypothetical protein
MLHINKAISGLDRVDIKILLSHDPNQGEEDFTGKTDINITFLEHTHGMQKKRNGQQLNCHPLFTLN